MFTTIKKIKIVITIFIILAVDQISKKKVLLFFVNNNIYYYKITHFLNFVKFWNAGISFGILGEYNLPPYLFVFISFIIVILILRYLAHIHPIVQGMIIGSAIGNAVDRMIFGQVFDFIDLHILDYHLPIFNIADIFIVFSTILLFIHFIVVKDKK